MKSKTIIEWAAAIPKIAIRQRGDIHGHQLLTSGMVSGRGIRRQAVDVKVPDFTLLYLLHGHGWYRDADIGEVELTPGVLLLRKPEYVHTVIRDPEPEWVEFFIRFPARVYQCICELGLLSSYPSAVYPGFLAHDMHDISKLSEALQEEAGELSLTSINLTISFLDHLLSRCCPQSAGDHIPGRIAEARRILQSKCIEHVQMEDIAKSVGLGYELFRKAFKADTGTSPKDYQIHCRIQQAQELLINRPYSVSELAEQLGYADVPTFTRQFKKVTGTTPGQYRKGYG